MKNLSKHLSVSFLALLLMISACKKEEEVPGQPPTVDAGPDLTGSVGNTVALAGTADDPDGDALTYTWSIVSAPSGSSATISSPDNLSTSFVPDAVGPYTLKLSVNDGHYDPVTDEVIVTVEEALGEPPVATIVNESGLEINAENENNTAPLGTNYLLDASDSYDPEQDELTFAWEVTSAPENADYTFTESANKQQVTFAPKTIGDYVIKVTVTDTDENVASAEVTLTATAESIIVTENVDADTTWIDLFSDPAMPDYIVKDNISVNALLNLEPGVVVHLDEDIILTVESGGTLVAQGTEDNKITFTSSDEAGQVYWGGLLFNSSSANNLLSHVKVSYGGGGDLMYLYGGVNSYAGANIGINENGKLQMTHTEISYSEGDGMVINGSDNLTLFTNNTFSNNSDYAMTISINLAGQIDTTNAFNDNTETNEKENTIRVYDSTLEEDQEWLALDGGASYLFVSDVTINAALTINEGTRLEFEEDVKMTIETEGTLIAKGTQDNKVVFTSANIGGGIKWGGILVNSSNVNNALDYVDVSHAGGSDILYIYNGINSYVGANIAISDNAKLKITNSIISHSEGHGIVVDDEGSISAFASNNFNNNSGYPILMQANLGGMVDEATVFTDNGNNTVTIYSSTLNDDASYSDAVNGNWKAMQNDVSYLFLGNITVEDSMVIAEGAQLKFAEEARLHVTSGYLKAIGIVDNLIVFTNTTQNSNALWGGILIESSNTNNQIKNAEVSYAGGADMLYIYGGINQYVAANIGVDEGGKLQLEGTKVANSGGYGLVVGEGQVNGLTKEATDPEATIEAANEFSGNTSDNVLFE